MIVVTTELCDRYVILCLGGELEDTGSVNGLADHLVAMATRDLVLVDLSDLRPIDDPAIGDLLSQVERRLHGRDVVVVHTGLEARRLLRPMDHALPVVPDIDYALRRSRSAQEPTAVEAR